MTQDALLPYQDLGSTELRCHRLGFGCYRVHRGNRNHEIALRTYLDRHGNLIDTSANYGDGLSEYLVGEVLRDYPRERIIVVTKGGYIQGENMVLAQQTDFPEVVRYAEGLWHCIHPQFLKAQIVRSLERMQLAAMDVFLLHNPEYFLTEIEHRHEPNSADHEEFYRRIREAFRFLETQVDRGLIRYYGISSNNFGLPASDPVGTSILRCLREAESLSAKHRFRIVQMPLNLFEPGGAVCVNNDRRTALEFCRDQGIGVLVNRPLNAFVGNRLIRLADFSTQSNGSAAQETLQSLLAPLRAHEQKIALELQVSLLGGSGLATMIEKIVPQLQSPAHWEQAAGPYLLHPLHSWLQEKQGLFAKDWRWQAWVEELIAMVHGLFEGIGRHLAAKEQHTSDEVRRQLGRASYPVARDSLSQMALNVLINTPGVGCTLVGMRKTAYVDDAMGAASLPPVGGLQILRRFNERAADASA